MVSNKVLEKVGWAVVILVGLILCVRELREPDMWWQLRAGEWMLKNRQITTEDVFSFTHANEPWINVKWLYEVIFAFFSNTLGPEVAMLLQMVSIITILFFLKKVTAILHAKEELATGIIGAGLILLFIHAERLNGRPEMTTYTLTAVYIYLFILFRESKSKIIFLLIPLQLFWTNMHEAYGVGVVMTTIFIVGTVVESILAKKGIIKQTTQNLLLPIIVGVVTISSIIINPNGFTMLSHYIEIYTQLKENTFTNENVSFTDITYWNYASISNLILFIICTLYLWINATTGNFKIKATEIIMKYGVVYLLLYFAFFYLSLQATRNAYFFACIAFPIYAAAINSFLTRIISVKKKQTILLIMCGVSFYISVGSGFFYEKMIDREKYGLRISTSKNPIGAANFLKNNDIKGHGFVDYFSSSFLLWYLKPDFKTYIDLRDLDIYSKKFMENVFNAYAHPDAELASGETLFEYMNTIDTFQYVVVLNSPQFLRFNRYMIHQDENFELVYADGLNSLYLKKSVEYASIITKYGIKNNKEVFSAFQKSEGTTLGNTISKIFWPLYKPYTISKKENRLLKKEYLKIIQ